MTCLEEKGVPRLRWPAEILLNWNDTLKISMASSSANDNPNLNDLPDDQQVMSRPNVANAASLEPKAGHAQNVNDFLEAAAVSQNMDSETTASRIMRRSQPQVQSVNDSQGAEPERAPTVKMPMSEARPWRSVDQASRTRVVVAELQEHRHGGQMRSAGFLNGVMRAVQAIPTAVEGIVNGGNPPAPGSSPAANDAVEYASARSSVSAEGRRDPPSERQVPATPLFNEEVVRRLHQMPSEAPHLYRMEMRGQESQRPLSTTSSDIQAEVRRQLNEMMAVHEDESRKLRAHVEQLTAENRNLRERVESRASQELYSSRPVNPKGFPGFGWFGKSLGSMMGMGAQSRSESVMDLRPSHPSPADIYSHPQPRSLDLGATFQQHESHQGRDFRGLDTSSLHQRDSDLMGPCQSGGEPPMQHNPRSVFPMVDMVPVQSNPRTSPPMVDLSGNMQEHLIGRTLMPLPLGPKQPSQGGVPQTPEAPVGSAPQVQPVLFRT